MPEASKGASHNDTNMIVEACLGALNQTVIKPDPDPIQMPADPIFLETDPIDLDENDDEIAKGGIQKSIEELYKDFQWTDKEIVLSKFMDTVDKGVVKKIFKVKCPLCNKVFMVCKSTSGNKVDYDTTLYEKHITRQHLF